MGDMETDKAVKNWRCRVNWSRIGSALLALVTLLAMAPYDLGTVATFFPPSWKPWVFIVGAIGTCFSRLAGGKKEALPAPPSVQNFYTFNSPRD